MRLNSNFDMDELVDSMPVGLERAVLRVLGFHVGREMALSREALVLAVNSLGIKAHERMVRACINQLRKEGHLICSTGGSDGGYWIARDWAELSEYLEREVRPRAMDLLEQEKALKAEAEKRWGALALQGKLF